MIQLTYQPAFDPFHAVFRMLRIISAVGPVHDIKRDQLRILDFYLLFPFKIENIRTIAKHRKFKKAVSRYTTHRPYGVLPQDRMLFEQMAPIQAVALETLAARRCIDPDLFRTGIVKMTSLSIPDELAEVISIRNDEDSELMEYMVAISQDIPLSGQGGLKERSGLMEYRYDAI